jgi:hypothetical protein
MEDGSIPVLEAFSFALWPADITYSKGRGAKEDQCSCFAVAISGHIPIYC